MFFARRNKVSHGTTHPKRRTRNHRLPNLETLESRVLLSGETVVVAWGGQLMEAAKDQYIVKANLATAAAVKTKLLAKGLHVTSVVKLTTNIFAVVDSADSVAKVEAFDKAHSGYAFSPNEVYHKAATVPSEYNAEQNGTVTGLDPMWQFYNHGQEINGVVGKIGADIGMVTTVPANATAGTGIGAWDIATGSSNVVVAILDDGIDTANPDLIANLWVNTGESAINGFDNDGNGVIGDLYGANFTTVVADGVGNGVLDAGTHGTAIATLIGGVGGNQAQTPDPNNPPDGVITTDENMGLGVNWRVKMMSVEIFTGAEDTATDASIIAGLEYVMMMKRRGVNIVAINMSFGRRYLGPASGIGDAGNSADTTVFDPPAINVFDAMGRAAGLGIIMVSAAGNNLIGGGGTNDDVFSYVPANFKNSLGITVGASTNLDTYEPTSNYGPNTVKIAAPGTSVGVFDGTTVTEYTGSSMSAALVTGAVALLKALKPSASASQIVNAIYNGADKIAAMTGQVQLGRRLNVLQAAEILVANPAPRFFVDILTSTRVAGWFFDQNSGSVDQHLGVLNGNTVVAGVDNVIVDFFPADHGINSGVIKVDGQILQLTNPWNGLAEDTFTVNADRPDLLGVVGSTWHGFDYDLGSLLSPVAHTVQVYMNEVQIDPLTGKFLFNADGTLKYKQVLMLQKTIPGNVMPTGAVETGSFEQGFTGWASDPNLGPSPVQVRVDVDGVTFTTIVADQNHGTAPIGPHGFSLPNPATTGNPSDPWLSAGIHRVEFFAIDDYTGDAVFIGAKTVVGNHTPVGTAVYDPVTRIITGQAWDPDNPTLPVSLQVVIDGVNGRRQYLDAVTSSGQNFTIQVPLVAPGTHELRLFAYDVNTAQTVQFLLPTVPTNTAPTGALDAIGNDITGYVTDPNTPNQSIFYRLNIDNNVGLIGLATLARSDLNVQFNTLGFSVPLPALLVGQHTITLFAIDSTTFAVTQVATQTIQVGEDINKRPTGAVEAFRTTGISGWATDPDITTGTDSTGININMIIDNDTANPVTVVASGARTDTHTGQGFTFDLTTLGPLLTPGNHFVQIFAEDSTDPTIQILLREGELSNNAPPPVGNLTDVNFLTLNGTVRGAANDTQPIFVIDVNGIYFQSFQPGSTTPLANPTASSFFTLPTPFLTATAGNSVRLRYLDPLTGVLTVLATRTIPATPVNQFVNGALLITTTLPTGALDSASQAGMTGWVGDADSPATTLQYRIDIDGIVGQLFTASLGRPDLSTSTAFATNTNHGFTYTPPALAIGNHTATLFAVDAQTGVASAVTSRTFTVRDTTNKKPIGAVGTFNATSLIGWAQDPTTKASAVSVSVFVDGSSSAAFPTPVMANGVRSDSHNGHGFTIAVSSLSLPAGTHYLEIKATDLSDPSVQVSLKAGTIEIQPTGLPVTRIGGFFDIVDFQTIAGWGSGPANDSTPTFVVNYNGQPFAVLSAANSNLTPSTEAGLNIQRFNLVTPPVAPSVTNTFQLYYIDKFTHATVLLATRTLAPRQTVSATVDLITDARVAGWAVSPTLPDAVVMIQVVIDGQPTLAGFAQLSRDDLTGPLENHAFDIDIPQLASGSHTITVRAVDPVSGDYLLLATKSVISP